VPSVPSIPCASASLRFRPPARLTLLLAAGLLSTTGQLLAQQEAEEPVISGSDTLSADQSGSEAATKLFTIHKLPDPDAPPNWEGQAQAGISSSTGNSESSNINASALVSYTSFPWRHYFSADINFAENDGDSTTERYAAAYKSEYFLSPRTFAFGFLSYDRDQFADIDSRYSVAIGLGHAILNSERNILLFDIGGGYRQTNYVGTTEDSGEAVGQIALYYSGRITNNTNFNQNLMTLIGSKNTYVESVTSLQVSMTDTLALSLNYTVMYNSFTPPDIESTDTFTSVSLVAAF
jgi:putative salt-induced outer membrane protein